MANVIIFTGIAESGLYRYVGPYQVANRLRERGYTVQVIDFLPWIIKDDLENFWKILKKFVDKDTLWIGFSTTFFKNLRQPRSIRIESQNDNTPFFIQEQIEIKQYVRSISPKCRFVIGGARAWIKTGEYLIDTYIEGYSDESVIKFTEWCEGKNPFLQFTVHNDISAISIVDDPKAVGFDFTNHKFSWHNSDHVFQGEAVPVELARGCIFSCAFCNYPLNGKKKLDYVKNSEILLDRKSVV